jgi:hypothetical protein
MAYICALHTRADGDGARYHEVGKSQIKQMDSIQWNLWLIRLDYMDEFKASTGYFATLFIVHRWFNLMAAAGQLLSLSPPLQTREDRMGGEAKANGR